MHDVSLFGDDASIASSEPVRAPSSIADRQVDLLRKAIDARGLASMAARQRTIEDAAGQIVAPRDLDEILRHVAAPKVAEYVEIVIDVRAENSVGFIESVARTIKKNSRLLGFDITEFEDVKW